MLAHWIIAKTDLEYTYLIVSNTSIWLTNQKKDTAIDALIESQNLGVVKSIRYDNLKDITFIDSDNTIAFNYLDNKTPDEAYPLDKTTFLEIRTYLKTNLTKTELKNYSILKQVYPYIVTLGVSLLVFALIYISANELEDGGTIKTSGRRGLIKKIIVALAEVLGTTGTLISGTLVSCFLVYLLIKKVQTPKIGEVLKLDKQTTLRV